MEKWRKKITLVLWTLGLLVLAPKDAQAQYCGDSEPCDHTAYCYPPCPMECYSVDVDFLWWKPCIDDLEYAAVESTCDNPDDKLKYKKICPDWEPGIRVTFKMPCFYCDWGLRASWSYIKSDHSSFVHSTNNILIPPLHPKIYERVTGNRIDTAKGEWHSCYHDWDILFTYDCSRGEVCSDCSHRFLPYFGVAGLFLDQKFDVKFCDLDPACGCYHWDSDYWGVGLRLGSEYEYQFSRCFSFFLNGSGTILAGERDGKQVSTGFVASDKFTVTEDDCCHIIPGFHLGTGLIYHTAMCHYDFDFRLGYEFVAWLNVPNHRIFTESEEYGWGHGTSSSTRTFAFHGLFAGFSFSF